MSEIVAASENDVVEAVRHAQATREPFEIVGARSKRNLGRATKGPESILDVSGIGGILTYEPEELIVTVLPGTRIVDIEAALAEKGQRLGFDPPDWGPMLGAPAGLGTIGGAISADACGSGRVRYGAVRDQLLGIRAVNGFGQAFKAGGKVVKNVTGFDIPKLVCGAFGTLCVLTEVTLRVFPKPSCSQTLSVRNVPLEDAFMLLRKVWSSPLEATGLACSPDAVFVRLEGEKEPLSEKLAMLKSLWTGWEIESNDDEDIFRQFSNGDLFLSLREHLWRVAIPPSAGASVAKQFESVLWTADWAGGVLWIATNDGRRLREVVRAGGGHAMLFRADAQTRSESAVFEIEDPVRARLTKSLKASFDPLGLFNCGRMWDGV